MVEAADIDWETINAKLPYERSAEAKEKRREVERAKLAEMKMLF